MHKIYRILCDQTQLFFLVNIDVQQPVDKAKLHEI